MYPHAENISDILKLIYSVQYHKETLKDGALLSRALRHRHITCRGGTMTVIVAAEPITTQPLSNPYDVNLKKDAEGCHHVARRSMRLDHPGVTLPNSLDLHRDLRKQYSFRIPSQPPQSYDAFILNLFLALNDGMPI